MLVFFVIKLAISSLWRTADTPSGLPKIIHSVTSRAPRQKGVVHQTISKEFH